MKLRNVFFLMGLAYMLIVLSMIDNSLDKLNNTINERNKYIKQRIKK